MQFYIVSGGFGRGVGIGLTEILKKEGGTSWQRAASLPSGRNGLRGVSLPNGHFMVSGEFNILHVVWVMGIHVMNHNASLQVDMVHLVCIQ